MLSAIDDLLSGRGDVDEESNAMKSQLDRMLSAYRAREKKYTAAVEAIKANHAAIIREAHDHAATLIANAERVASEMISSAEEKSREMIEQATEESEEIRETVEEDKEEWEAEKASLVDVQTFEPIVKINIGGSRFDTSLTTLTRFPETMIGAMFSGRHTLVLDKEGYHFIDRDGTHFRYILNFLRSPETFTLELTGAALKELKNECEYYGLTEDMFPFTPIPAFTIKNAANQPVTVQHDDSGIFSVDGIPVRVCSRCGCGNYASTSVAYQYNQYHYSSIPLFKSTVESKGGVIDADQPVQGVNACFKCRNLVVGSEVTRS